MKNLSVKLKITIWFSVIMIIIVGVTFGIIMKVNRAVMQKTIQDNLVETVEDNVDEVEFYSSMRELREDHDVDHYISYKDGYLEIDDDFLDQVNGVYTALYQGTGEMLYGENPLTKSTSNLNFSDGIVQTIKYEGVRYYIFDRALSEDGTEGLWLRGMVSENQGTAQLTSVVRISAFTLPALLLLAIIGGYWLAGRALKPVHKITEAAVQIGQGSDLNKRIDLGPGNDELHQLANVFDDMFGRLDRAFRAEQQFTSDASHELRTPMSVIMAQCEYTLEKPRTEEEYEEALYVIQRQGRKMSRLIEDMLCFARLDQNRDVYPKEQFNFTELVEDICGDMALLKDKGIELTWSAREDVFVWGNRDLLSRMLTNLISNGYRYGKENGKIEVTLSCADEILLKVEDDGIGISEDQQEKIFERFYRADEARATEGTGLGLAMVRDIAKYHKGKIEVTSHIGQGSAFVVHLPEYKKINSF